MATTRAAGRRRSARPELIKFLILAAVAGFFFAVNEDVSWALAVWGVLVDAWMAISHVIAEYFADSIIDGIEERQPG